MADPAPPDPVPDPPPPPPNEEDEVRSVHSRRSRSETSTDGRSRSLTPRFMARLRRLMAREEDRDRNRERNRDTSRNRNTRRPEGEPEVIIQEDEQTVSSSDEDSVDYMTFMQDDPLGNILFNMAQDTVRITEHTNLNENSLNLKKIGKTYYKHRQQQQPVRVDEESLMARVEKKLLDKELNSHSLTHTFDLPSYFSPVPTLLTPQQRNEALKLFPTRSQRFSGVTDEKSSDIVEFLNTITHAQEVLKLSKKEFLECLKLSTTGKAHSLLTEWLTTDSDIANIYHNFGLHYDTRLTANDARKQLHNFKVEKGSNLAEAIATINYLAGRSCTNLPQGEARTSLFDMEVCTTIIRSLPPMSSSTAQNCFSTLSAKLGRACKAGEFARALNLYRATIDTDIKQNGSDKKAGQGQQNNGKKKYKPWKGKQGTGGAQSNAPTVFAISHVPQSDSSSSTSAQAGSLQDGQVGKKKGKWKDNGKDKKSRAAKWLDVPYCSLCGHSDHRAADSCPFMINDQKQKVSVIPTHSPCKACPNIQNPRLNHPSSFCPYRPKGPWAHKK